jgi:hypothetical protein
MAQIADDWDELVNPVLHPHPMGRAEAISFLFGRSGDYKPGARSARYDKVLLEDFLRVLRPWAIGERVDLYMDGLRSRRYYCGFVRGYRNEASLMPEVCVLKNEVVGESYAFGRVVLDLDAGRVLLLDDKGKVGASIPRELAEEKDEKGEYRVKNPKVREMLRQLPSLQCLDDLKDSWMPAEYADPVFDVRKPVK